MPLSGEAKRLYNSTHYQNDKDFIKDRYNKGWNFESDLKAYIKKHIGQEYDNDDIVEAFMNCTTAEIKDWIESQFETGMDWGNYGTVWKLTNTSTGKRYKYASEARCYLLNPALLSPIKVEHCAAETVDRVLRWNARFENKVTIPNSDFKMLDKRDKLTKEAINKIDTEYEREKAYETKKVEQQKRAGYAGDIIKLVMGNDIGVKIPLPKLDELLATNLETLRKRDSIVRSEQFMYATPKQRCEFLINIK